MEGELANNQEKEKKIALAERQSAKFRIDYQNSENARILFYDEVNIHIIIAGYLKLKYNQKLCRVNSVNWFLAIELPFFPKIMQTRFSKRHLIVQEL